MDISVIVLLIVIVCGLSMGWCDSAPVMRFCGRHFQMFGLCGFVANAFIVLRFDAGTFAFFSSAIFVRLQHSSIIFALSCGAPGAHCFIFRRDDIGVAHLFRSYVCEFVRSFVRSSVRAFICL